MEADTYQITVEPGITITFYTATAGSLSESGLRLLGSWTAQHSASSNHAPITERPSS